MWACMGVGRMIVSGGVQTDVPAAFPCRRPWTCGCQLFISDDACKRSALSFPASRRVVCGIVCAIMHSPCWRVLCETVLHPNVRSTPVTCCSGSLAPRHSRCFKNILKQIGSELSFRGGMFLFPQSFLEWLIRIGDAARFPFFLLCRSFAALREVVGAKYVLVEAL